MLTFEYTKAELDIKETFYRYNGKETTDQDTKDLVNGKWTSLMEDSAVTYLRSIMDIDGHMTVLLGKQPKPERKPIRRGKYYLVTQCSYKDGGDLYSFMTPCQPKDNKNMVTDDENEDPVKVEGFVWMTVQEITVLCKKIKRNKLSWIKKGGNAA